ncbi:protein BTG2-like [Artemia franciscana]|uniref:Anti-proliferative protein domain-containing protein n=1 Tax=Artemia franciscana TaxID=6661 RepID=A0AA88HH91_ARTSF|nr:hypothetical protein QYM36_012974 [Artemia franciscana]KAK2709160.1 hypothetical protein QYM36_012978 [Artemia franciscana]
MRLEVTSAANFLVSLVRLKKTAAAIPQHQLDMLRENIIETLRLRYRDHWFPERPCKGSGYRCIRINGKIDPLLAQAGEDSGIPATFLYTLFPSELTMWVDPSEVSYRIGENGSICVLYDERQIAESIRLAQLSPTPSSSSYVSTPSSSPGLDYSDSSCKLDFAMDARNILAYEHMAAFVAS